jgi:hypothetical protein
MRRRSNHTEQKNEENRRKLVRKQNHAQRNKFCGTVEQTNEGNVGFFVRNSPTSEADQNFYQFISPSRLKYCTKILNEPVESEKAATREPKTMEPVFPSAEQEGTKLMGQREKAH